MFDDKTEKIKLPDFWFKINRDFRCKNNDFLFVKTSVNSTIEGKCRKCKTLNYFIQGTSFFLNESTVELEQF